MKAYVSGQAAVVVYWESEKVVWRRSLDSAKPERCSPADIPYILADTSGIRELDVDSHEEALSELGRSYSQDLALRLLLMCLDAASLDESRQEALGEIESLLGEPSVLELVEKRLYSAPLPESTALSRCIAMAEHGLRTVASGFLKELESCQEPIARVHRAFFEALPARLFGNRGREAYWQAAVGGGVCRRLVRLIGGLEPGSKDVYVQMQKALSGVDPEAKVLRAWVEELDLGNPLPSPVGLRIPREIKARPDLSEPNFFDNVVAPMLVRVPMLGRMLPANER